MTTTHPKHLAGALGEAGAMSPPQAALLAVLAVLVFHAFLAVWGPVGVFSGDLFGTDSYTRMVRVAELHRSGDWSASRLERVNPPDGVQQHWTRPMDAALLAGAVALEPLFGFDRALRIWAGVLPPLLHLAATAGLVWGAAAFLEARRLPLIGLVGAVQPLLLSNFSPGRVDHNALVLCLIALAVAFALRLLYARRGPRMAAHAAAAGAAMALAVWTSAEALVPLFGVLLACGLLWLADRPRSGRSRALATAMGVLGASALAVAAAGLVVEHGAGGVAAHWFVPDRLSLFHAACFAAWTGVWLGIAAIAARRPAAVATARGRLAVAAACGAAGAGLLLALFPQVVAEAWVPMDDFYREHRFRYILEYQPVVDFSGSGPDALASSAKALVHLGLPIVGLAYLGYAAWASRHGEAGAAWLVIAATAAVTAVLLGAIGGLTWHDAPYLQLLLVIPYADAVVRAARAAAGALAHGAGAALSVLVVAALTAWPLVGAAALAAAGPGQAGAASCPLDGVARRINALELQAPVTILAHPDLATELLYKTRHDVISIPNHRYHPGFRAMFEAFAATPDGVGRRIVEDNAVGLVVVCAVHDGAFAQDARGPGAPLHRRLLRGEPPAWLAPLELGPGAGAVRLYRVRGTQSERRGDEA